MPVDIAEDDHRVDRHPRRFTEEDIESGSIYDLGSPLRDARLSDLSHRILLKSPNRRLARDTPARGSDMTDGLRCERPTAWMLFCDAPAMIEETVHVRCQLRRRELIKRDVAEQPDGVLRELVASFRRLRRMLRGARSLCHLSKNCANAGTVFSSVAGLSRCSAIAFASAACAKLSFANPDLVTCRRLPFSPLPRSNT